MLFCFQYTFTGCCLLCWLGKQVASTSIDTLRGMLGKEKTKHSSTTLLLLLYIPSWIVSNIGTDIDISYYRAFMYRRGLCKKMSAFFLYVWNIHSWAGIEWMIRLLVFLFCLSSALLAGWLAMLLLGKNLLVYIQNEASYRNFTLQLIITFPPYQLIERMFFILIACYTKLLMYECIKKRRRWSGVCAFQCKILA